MLGDTVGVVGPVTGDGAERPVTGRGQVCGMPPAVSRMRRECRGMETSLLAEDLWVLSHHPENGRRLVDATRLSCGMAGSVLADLALRGCVGVERHAVLPTGMTSSGDRDLDVFLGLITASTRARKPSWWVARLRAQRYRSLLVGRAVRRGLVRHERVTQILVFSQDRYVPTRPAERMALVGHLRAVLTNSTAPDPRSAALLALVGAVRLDGPLFPDIPARERRRLVREIVAHDAVGVAVRTAIEVIESATVAAASIAVAGGDGGGS